MKLGLVTKLEKRNTATSKRFENDVMPASCESNSDLLSYTPTSKRTFKKPVQILVKECFLPKRCHIWFIFSEIQIPFSLKKDNSKNRSHFLCLSFIQIVYKTHKISNCQDIPVKKKQKKVKFSARETDVKKECIIYVYDASKIMQLTSSQQILGRRIHGLI